MYSRKHIDSDGEYGEPDKMFTYEQMCDLLVWNDSFDGIIRNPAKPAIHSGGVDMWTGNQIYSTILPQMNYKRGDDAFDNVFTVVKGQIETGTVWKNHIGAKAGNIVHVLVNDFGPRVCKDFLDNSQKLINNWLLTDGFSVGISDCIADPLTQTNIKKIISVKKKEVYDFIYEQKHNMLVKGDGFILLLFMLTIH